jgi:hypothetical protein
MNQTLFGYSVFGLTFVITLLYLFFYPKNPTIFAVFRIHTLVVG